MPETITAERRRLVWARARNCCEYCLIQQTDTPASHEIDHLIARKHGGQSVIENLAIACLQCNRNKGSDLTAIDPESQTVVPLFNPRVQLWPEHFGLAEARIVGLTPTGRATTELLKFNTPVRVEFRQLLMEETRYPPAVLEFLAQITHL
jgi:hypothetical protein